MKFDKATLEKGLGNSLVRAYILRDFVLPFKGYSLKQLIGNQTSSQSFRTEEWETFFDELNQKKDFTAFPVMGPLIYQNNLASFHLFDDFPIEEIFTPTLMDACEIYNDMSNILGDKAQYGFRPLVYSFGISVGEESCAMNLSITSSRIKFGPSDESLPVTGISGYNPYSIQIGLSNYTEEPDYPSVELLGILADPHLEAQAKKERLLREFHVDIDRTREEDYAYLEALEEKARENDDEESAEDKR